MAVPFTPRRADGRAEWRVVYDLAKDLPYGRELTYTDIATALGAENTVNTRNRIHRAVKRCNDQFIAENRPRVLGSIRGVGYKILEPAEYTSTAIALRKRAAKTITSASDLMRTAPLDDMTPAQRDWAHKVTMVMMDFENRFRSSDERHADAEQRLRDLEERMGARRKTTVVDSDGVIVEERAS